MSDIVPTNNSSSIPDYRFGSDEKEIFQQTVQQLRDELERERDSRLAAETARREEDIARREEAQKIRDAEAMRHESRKNGNGNGNHNGTNGQNARYSLFKDWNLTPASTLVILSIALTGVYWVWDVSMRVPRIELNAKAISEAKDKANTQDNRIADLEKTIKVFNETNANTIDNRNKYREGINGIIVAFKDDIGELKSQYGSLSYQMAENKTNIGAANARMDRTFDVYNKRFEDSKTVDAETSGDIKVLRDQMQRVINWLEAGARKPNAPFDQNQMWIEPPTNPALPILRAIHYETPTVDKPTIVKVSNKKKIRYRSKRRVPYIVMLTRMKHLFRP